MGRHSHNVVTRLRDRELGRRRSVNRCRFILKSLVCSPGREFLPSGEPLVTQGDFIYGDGKLYRRNNGTKSFDCYSLGGTWEMKRLYSIPTRPKWEDQEIVLLSLPNGLFPPLPGSSHRACLFVLRLNNTLHRYDLQNGTHYESLYLSSFTRFKELSFDSETGLIALKSVRRVSESCRGALTGCNSNKAGEVNFIILKYPPTEFVAHFEVTKSVFGDKVVDAAVNQGILIIMHSDYQIRLYSVEYILSHFVLREYRLNDKIDEDSFVGQSPLGLPINVKITHIPPCLMEVKSHHHHLQIGSIPWRYIVCQGEGHFKVEDLQTGLPLGNGTIKSKDDLEPDHLLFHPDDSSRIVHIGSSQLRILDIVSSNEFPSKCKLRQIFSFSPETNRIECSSSETDENMQDSSSLPPLPQVPEFTSSGRRIIRPATFNLEDISEAKHDLSFDYEDELDILAVLYALEYVPDDNEDFSRTRLEKVILIDNQNQEILREIPIGQEIRQGTDVSSIHITLDRDVLLIRLRSSVKTTAFIFRLQEANLDEDDDTLMTDEEQTIGESSSSNLRRRILKAKMASRRRKGRDVRTLRRRSTWNEPFSDLDDDEDGDYPDDPFPRILMDETSSRRRHQSQR